MHSVMEMIRDIDINHTKMMFTETYGKLYVEEEFLNASEDE